MIDKWDHRFLNLADHISAWSKDPSTKVGAVIADPNLRVVSMGFNGFPVRIPDKEEWLNDREMKYEMTIHGDMNAIVFAKQSLIGCTMYTVPFPPCSRCAAVIVQVGIRRVVSRSQIPTGSNRHDWMKSVERTRLIFNHARVELEVLEI